MTDERCCANCARWQRSTEEWEHSQWNRWLYRRVIQDAKDDEERWERLAKEYEERHGEKLEERSLHQASCLRLGWGNWGWCAASCERGKALLCWDERR